MKRSRWTLAACGAMLIGAVAQAQTQTQEQNAPPAESVRVFRLGNSNPHNVVQAVNGLRLGVRCAVDERGNAVLVAGTEALLEQVGGVIEQLDVKNAAAAQFELRTIRLKNRSVDAVEPLLHQVSSVSLMITSDAANQMIILRGSPPEVAAAIDFIEQIDTPQRSIGLSFFFIGAKIGESKSPTMDLPAPLEPVGRALLEQGFTDVRMAAPLTTRVQEGSEFSTSGSLLVVDRDDYKLRADFRVEGVVEPGADPGASRVRVEAEVLRHEEDTEDYDRAFSAETTLLVPFGEFVVLAAAPSSNSTNVQAIALVIRVDAQ